jgi:hypothetical protein
MNEFNPVSVDCRTTEEDLRIAIMLNPRVENIKNAMDENGRQMCLELLEYMAKNNVDCATWEDGSRFLIKGEFITTAQLFENFL